MTTKRVRVKDKTGRLLELVSENIGETISDSVDWLAQMAAIGDKTGTLREILDQVDEETEQVTEEEQ